MQSPSTSCLRFKAVLAADAGLCVEEFGDLGREIAVQGCPSNVPERGIVKLVFPHDAVKT